jgi:hypothetical protein
MAALGEDYEANRGKLLDALQACSKESYPQGCTYYIVDYLMELTRRGDNSLFHPIFESSKNSDGAFSQSLGGSYSDMLQEKSNQFLAALASYSKERQRDFCRNAGIEDGGGMDEERFRSVSRLLNQISAKSPSLLSNNARNCLSGVEAGYDSAAQQAKPRGATQLK